jgi:hypothetical protein
VPLDPARLDQLADETFSAAKAAREAGQTDRALELYARAETLQEWAAQDRRLTAGGSTLKVHGVNLSVRHRQKLSEAMLPPPADGAEDWMTFARKAGLPSVRAIAKALGCTASFISAINKGRKTMPADKAAKFEKLTGYPAKLWPTY